MSEEGLETIVQVNGNKAVVGLSGTVNRGAKEKMEAAYVEASAAPGEIVLDFSRVDYINSTGIAVIVGVLAMARADDRQVSAFGLTDHYREVFEITRLADFMNIREDASTAD